MAHVETHAAEGIVDGPKLLYGLNDKPPVKDSIFVALQHVCAIFIPVVTPGLLIIRTFPAALRACWNRESPQVPSVP